MNTFPRSLLLSLFLLPALVVHADTTITSYVLKESLQLTDYLPPPPQADSAVARADLKAVLDLQKSRTLEQTTRVQAHDQWEDNIFPFAKDILGEAFDKEQLPLTRQFFQRVQENLVEVLMPAKKHFARPRPYELEPSVKPVLPPPEGDSYPSGHSMDSYLNATLLSIAVPEKHDELFARARAHADSRVLAGVHYPSDLQGGQIAAAALAGALLADSRIAADFAAVRQEVRKALMLAER
ncbi:putative acid phosphatase [Pseudomonas chlororaphis subsp. aureofaciens]|uniref:acid phosphatase n=1 Tax=Pseudomonas chlororaphis TaxID=587753 RepID=UPI000F583BDE|nr:phosphatase PAP2 family protein [Pseudomonas chlororaphis]AZD84276.1 putative acid phosphatase [Pseudomonas chlororaphis subsp. aureofaciens]